MDHPTLERIQRTGYAEAEHIEYDAMGDEISAEDKVYETEGGDLVLEKNLDEYIEKYHNINVIA